MVALEVVKYVVLALHVIGVAGILGGVIYQIPAMRRGEAKLVSGILHGAWLMLITGVALVGLNYPLDVPVNNIKISVKLAVLVAILVIALIHRKRETLKTWVLPTIGGLTVLNVFLATVWRSYS